MLSDLLGGVPGGFRYSNQWLAILTGGMFPATFYRGDALGSLISWIRLISGILLGIGIVWFAHPRLHASFNETAKRAASETRRRKAHVNIGSAAEERYGS